MFTQLYGDQTSRFRGSFLLSSHFVSIKPNSLFPWKFARKPCTEREEENEECSHVTFYENTHTIEMLLPIKNNFNVFLFFFCGSTCQYILFGQTRVLGTFLDWVLFLACLGFVKSVKKVLVYSTTQWKSPKGCEFLQ